MIALIAMFSLLGAIIFGVSWIAAPLNSDEISLYGFMAVACMVVYGLCQALL